MFNKKIALMLAFVVLLPAIVSAQDNRFDWKFYNRSPVLTLANNDDLTVVRVLTGEEGVANQKLMVTALCLTFFGTEQCDQRFLDQVADRLRTGEWQWKTYEQDNTDLFFPLSHGVVVKGVRKAAVTKSPPIVHTKGVDGQLIEPRARLLDPIQLSSGQWVRVVIFEQCYNTSGELFTPPLPPVAPPPPPPPPVVQKRLVPPPPQFGRLIVTKVCVADREGKKRIECPSDWTITFDAKQVGNDGVVGTAVAVDNQAIFTRLRGEHSVTESNLPKGWADITGSVLVDIVAGKTVSRDYINMKKGSHKGLIAVIVGVVVVGSACALLHGHGQQVKVGNKGGSTQ